MTEIISYIFQQTPDSSDRFIHRITRSVAARLDRCISDRVFPVVSEFNRHASAVLSQISSCNERIGLAKEFGHLSFGFLTTTSTPALFLAIMFAGKMPRQLTFG